MGLGRRFFLSTIKKEVGLPFISEWRTTNTSSGSSDSDQVKLPLISTGTYNFVVNWGDGNSDTITTWDQAQTTHTYASSGDYTITITGTCTGWSFRSTGDRLKILDISQWGSIIFTPNGITTNGVFTNCSNIDVTATDKPTFQNGNQVGFFSGCSSLVGNSSFNNWDVSLINRFERFFLSCTNFNQPLSDWDVSSSTNFRLMFQGCTNFNQDLSNWDVSASTTMESMFQSCTNFSQPLNTWDVSNVISFGNTANTGMFQNASNFNQPLNNWDVSSATSMRQMFNGATSFNQDLSSWDVSNVTNFISTFQNANSFAQNLGDWVLNSSANLTTMLNVSTSTVGIALQEWYSRTLIGWANRVYSTGIPINTNLGAANRRYNSTNYTTGLTFNNGNDARTFLVTAGTPPTGAGWTILGDVLI